MNQQELKEYLRKNKTVAFGVPFIVGVLMLDLLVLKPSREAKKKAAAGPAISQTQTPAAAPTAAAPGADPAAKPPIQPPAPIVKPVYPALSDKIESRFAANQLYPYEAGRNMFIWPEKPGTVFVSQETGEQAPVIERPDISYHGFFTLGSDRVAILRFADELLLTRIGATLKRTPFCLTEVTPEKIIISDTSEEGLRDFEIALTDQPAGQSKEK
ncbi:MAG TPA: hypothetical protein PLR50_10785 [Candidatus Rifleibacterium sp.]|nr:hypothetical protein [Candidatus Ozemobacteraceae bacterium]HNW10131.1 hypothetical protein [Candidatus Rifleibacterium sp.]HPW58249.1 hypothetical protein [Candidatus Rifleibacterium sp.]HQB83973.1 hypothetical protein [Candidatus Rifleibacterium sp.]